MENYNTLNPLSQVHTITGNHIRRQMGLSQVIDDVLDQLDHPLARNYSHVRRPIGVDLKLVLDILWRVARQQDPKKSVLEAHNHDLLHNGDGYIEEIANELRSRMQNRIKLWDEDMNLWEVQTKKLLQEECNRLQKQFGTAFGTARYPGQVDPGRRANKIAASINNTCIEGLLSSARAPGDPESLQSSPPIPNVYDMYGSNVRHSPDGNEPHGVMEPGPFPGISRNTISGDSVKSRKRPFAVTEKPLENVKRTHTRICTPGVRMQKLGYPCPLPSIEGAKHHINNKCDGPFETVSSVRSHLIGHWGKKFNSCPAEGCESFYTRGGNLMRHIKGSMKCLSGIKELSQNQDLEDLQLQEGMELPKLELSKKQQDAIWNVVEAHASATEAQKEALELLKNLKLPSGAAKEAVKQQCWGELLNIARLFYGREGKNKDPPSTVASSPETLESTRHEWGFHWYPDVQPEVRGTEGRGTTVGTEGPGTIVETDSERLGTTIGPGANFNQFDLTTASAYPLQNDYQAEYSAQHESTSINLPVSGQQWQLNNQVYSQAWSLEPHHNFNSGVVGLGPYHQPPASSNRGLNFSSYTPHIDPALEDQ